MQDTVIEGAVVGIDCKGNFCSDEHVMYMQICILIFLDCSYTGCSYNILDICQNYWAVYLKFI